jgi:rod shape-determining protein MreD
MMVRSALTPKRRIGEGPHPASVYVPAISVLAASLVAVLPVMSPSGWYPDLAFLALIAWRLLRPDPWPAWWAAPLGLVNDIVTGYPIGYSVALWAATMIALDLVERRTMWRDYWVEWALAALLILGAETFHWWIATLGGADVPFRSVLPSLLISVLCFPAVAWVVSRIDRWRLGQ